MEKDDSYTKQHSICNNNRNMKQMHDFKAKVSSFDYTSNLGDGDLMAAGFCWPPRSYICSFCKREFRSAQALGGHMNVHRRDRARLRQSPARDGRITSKNGGQLSRINLNLEPNPTLCSNPSFAPSSPPPAALLSSHVTKSSPPSEIKKCGGDAVPITTDSMKLKAVKGLRGVERFESSVCKKGFVGLELGMGLTTPFKEELDLELRLGYN